MKQTKKNTIQLAIPLVFIIVMLLAYVFLYVPVRDKMDDLDKRIEMVNIQYLRNASTVNNFDEYLNRFREYDNMAKQTRDDEAEKAFFLKEFETIVGPMQLSVNDIKPLPVEEEQFKKAFFIKVEMTGAIKECISFLHKIASNHSLVHVENMTITSENSRTSLLTYEMTISKTFLK